MKLKLYRVWLLGYVGLGSWDYQAHRFSFLAITRNHPYAVEEVPSLVLSVPFPFYAGFCLVIRQSIIKVYPVGFITAGPLT
jgi:hypothetical protein